MSAALGGKGPRGGVMDGSRKPARLRAGQSALPGALPPGEHVLWHGAPQWRALARNALHLRGVAIYLGILVTWVAASSALRGEAAGAVLRDTGLAALAACVPLAVGIGYAWLAARAAAYTITNRRVVIRMGLVVPVTLNLPFSRIDSAGLGHKADGTGDIALQLAPGSQGLGWFIMWPHTRPWHYAPAQPALRCLKDADHAARLLGEALLASTSTPGSDVLVAQVTGKVDSAECHHGETAVTA